MPHVIPRETCRDWEAASRLEWCLPNGVGGFAMGTVSGANQRRYHGHLVAATQRPSVRMVLLANIEATVSFGAETFELSCNQYLNVIHPRGYTRLASFSAGSIAEWEFELGRNTIVKRLGCHPGENAVTIEFENRGKSSCQLRLCPLVCHKFYHDNFRATDYYPEYLVFPDHQTVVAQQGVTLYLRHEGASRAATSGWYYRFLHSRETERGLEDQEDLFCPCELEYTLAPGQIVRISASTESGVEPIVLQETETDDSTFSRMQEACKKFVVSAPERETILAGYPWFTDWGRDTMISLPGCLLHTGQVEKARQILESFALEMRQGLIPNRFVDRGDATDYNTVDATLWFGNAIYRTLQAEWNEEFAQKAIMWLSQVVHWHRQGTRYGIKVDPNDGLLMQGEPGVQLTWMDAKIGDWVVTPRHGKPIEICALWINLLRVCAWLSEKLGQDDSNYLSQAGLAEANFEQKFWHPIVGHYLDTVEPDDASLRPNQVIAMALPFSPCAKDHAKLALSVVKSELVTPVGLRTLGPKEPAYVGRFEGDMRERDAAYHQGTVWPWLLGSYLTALVKVTGEVEEAKQHLSILDATLEEYGLGGIAEVYDGDAPHRPGGCPWQAWSSAELLRAWCEDLDPRVIA